MNQEPSAQEMQAVDRRIDCAFESIKTMAAEQQAQIEALKVDKAEVAVIEAKRAETCDRLRAQVATLTEERDRYKTLAAIGVWHNDCRPNRRQAADTIAHLDDALKRQAALVTDLTAERDEARRRVESVRVVLSFWLEAQDLDPRGFDDTGTCDFCGNEGDHEDHGFCPSQHVVQAIAILDAPSAKPVEPTIPAGDGATYAQS